MYRDQKKLPVFLILTVLAVVAFLLFESLSVSGKDNTEETTRSLKEAIQRSALQCYVVEGVYPPDLDYLKENYGLTVNSKDYYIDYEIFAENLPPEIRVIPRKKAEK
ncbi:MAG: hypothetical protein IKS51_08165 [Erysipelotrichaceae bacterium]|nr:hypothetical protein [Erysipelotrichaceae bacterium]